MQKNGFMVTVAAGCGLVAVALGWGLMPWHAVESVLPFRQHDLRIINCLVPLALGMVPFLAAWVPALRPTFHASRRRLFLGFTCAVLLWQVGASWVWVQFTRTFTEVLDTRSGLVPFEATDLGRFHFDQFWTVPSLSILLCGIERRPVKAMVLNPSFGTWQPFDPKVKATLPPLGAYHVRYALEDGTP